VGGPTSIQFWKGAEYCVELLATAHGIATAVETDPNDDVVGSKNNKGSADRNFKRPVRSKSAPHHHLLLRIMYIMLNHELQAVRHGFTIVGPTKLWSLLMKFWSLHDILSVKPAPDALQRNTSVFR